MFDEMCFEDDVLKEVPVRIKKTRYVLREASADAARQYRNAAASGAVFNQGAVTTGTRVGDVQPLLVSLCLFKVLEWDDAENKALAVSDTHVPLDVVLSWPESIVRPLFQRAKEISTLGEAEGDEAKAKNLQTG